MKAHFFGSIGRRVSEQLLGLYKTTRLENFSVTDRPIAQLRGETEATYRRLYQQLHANPGPQVEAQIIAAIEKFPEAESFKQFLASYYRLKGQDAAMNRAIDLMVEAHPDYLFSRTEMAARAREKGKVDEYLRWMGAGLELHEIYPEHGAYCS